MVPAILEKMTYEILEKHTGPDQKLTFIVTLEGEDVSLGFENFAWHTHGDMLAAENQSPKDTAKVFIDDLLHDKILIMVIQVDAEVKDVSVTNDPESELKYKLENEELEFRFWSGNAIYKNQQILSSGVRWRFFH